MADITALGELLIDFTSCGKNGQGQNLFAQNPGGAPANVAVAVSRLGGKSAFIGKVGNDMHGRFLADTLKENAETVLAHLKSKYTNLEISLVNGGQPVYYYIVSVE